MKRRQCKKCGGTWIIGPRYDRAEDVLRYECACGYMWPEPTKDSKVDPQINWPKMRSFVGVRPRRKP